MISIIPISIVLGVGTTIYLEEYAKDNFFTSFVKISISNLAGVPSIVFGLLGLTLFVRGGGIQALALGNSVIAAALTMSLLILPIIIVSSREAIRAVPNSVREASCGLGANKWQTIRRVVLPAALPGILTGFILSLSRALGETAPLILIGIPTILCNTNKHYVYVQHYQLKFTLGLKCLKLNSKCCISNNYYITCNLITNERSSHFLT